MKFISILLLTAMVTIAMEKYTARYLLVEIDDGKHGLFSYVLYKDKSNNIIFNNLAVQGDGKFNFFHK